MIGEDLQKGGLLAGVQKMTSENSTFKQGSLTALDHLKKIEKINRDVLVKIVI